MSSAKVKTLREDFVVDELTNFSYQAAASDRKPAGIHAVYKLKKSGIGTLEAANEVLQRWNLPRSALSYAGRKDRHAVTSQWITLREGPPESIEERTFSVLYVGQAMKAITAENLQGNQFQIVLRNLSEENCTAMQSLLDSGAPCIPNYFDEQRFGSVSTTGEFAAVPWCLGDYERAAYLALAEDNDKDSPAERAQREILRQHWGDWPTCKEQLARSNRRSVITYLMDHPAGFKKAVALIHRDQRSLYVSALQSRIWNEVVSRWLKHRNPTGSFFEIDSLGGLLRFPLLTEESTQQELSEASVPLPSSRPTKWPHLSKEAQVTVKNILGDVCGELGLQPHKLRFSHPRDVFFARAQRPVLLQVQELSFEFAEDELASAPMKKLILKFSLGPGQYATMLLKALQRA